jgi:Lipocalin-like domain
MKLSKIFFSALMICAVAFVACKGGGPEAKLARKWKLSSITMPGIDAKVADSLIKVGATMEFTKDGKFTFSGMGQSSSGTYKIDKEGKTLTTTENGKEESMNVTELTDKSLKVAKGTETMGFTAE